MYIKYAEPYWDHRETEAAIGNIKTSKWLSSGDSVVEFEERFSKKLSQKYGLMLNSGSSANLVAVSACKRVFNWQDGDEVILGVVQFPTTVAPIIQNNLKPVFVDAEFTGLNFDLNQIESKITNKTKAIVLSPAFGNPPDMDRLSKICKDHNLLIILDYCDSLGTTWNQKWLPEFAVVSTYSFYASHHICTIEGGMVTTNDQSILKACRRFAFWGRDCSCRGTDNLLPCGKCGVRFKEWLPNCNCVVDHKYVYTEIGYNLKPLDLQGSIGLIQLEKLDEIIAKRKSHKQIIEDLFLKYCDIRVAKVLPQADVSWFCVPLVSKQKNQLVAHLEANGIQTRNFFANNILQQPAFCHLGNFKDYPEAQKFAETVFFVGCAPHYTQETFDYIEQVLSKFESI